MTFKIVASQGGRLVFDQRVEAETPREAREAMKRALGLESLAGLVYAITEIPAALIEEIVAAKMARDPSEFRSSKNDPPLPQVS